MRKIINNRLYDTDTAREVGTHDNGEMPGDFGYVSETLYRKKTGEYFLHGEGGARTRYARQDCGLWASGEAITPLSYDAAREWAEANLDADAYEAAFGAVAEDGGEVALTVRVPASAKAALDRECSRTGEGQSAIVARLLGTL